jgi:hypothetical protein
VTVPVYNGMLMLGYSTIFTMLPVFSIIFDEDVDVSTALAYVNLFLLFNLKIYEISAPFVQEFVKRKIIEYKDFFRMALG